jgi:signal transduction histidine kinase
VGAQEKPMNIIKSYWNRQRLAGKYFSMLVAATLVIAPIVYIALETLLMPTFVEIENRAAADQNARARHALDGFNEALTNAVKDYALWDPVYAYVDKPDPALENETLTPMSYQNVGVDVMAIVRFDGKVQWSNAVNRETQKVLSDETQFFATFFGQGRYFELAVKNKSTTSYVRTSRGLYVMHSTWVTKSDGSGVPRGYMAMGILLDEKAMSDALQVVAKLTDSVPTDLAQKLRDNKNHIFSNTLHDKISTSLGLFGNDGKALGLLSFSTPRVISAAGNRSVATAEFAMLCALLALVLLLSLGIKQISVSRLKALEDHVRNFRSSDTEVNPALSEGSDEIASLAHGFSTLAGELRDAEEQLRQRSYLQGKADSAAGMLHNVRNALAPVRVLQEKWVREEQLPFRENLKKALDELADPAVEITRKASIEQYVIAAARKIAELSDTRFAELQEAQDSIDHIAIILGSYNFDTSANKAGDKINIAALINREAKQLSARTNKSITVEVANDLPDIMGNQVQLSQILSNVFVNAVEAMEAAQTENMKIIISCETATDTDMIALHISDNGEGIDADTLSTIFDRGFSTRNHKSGGIGLHWSANAMRAMGGSLAFLSEGKGKGATAVLTLERVPAQKQAMPLAA